MEQHAAQGITVAIAKGTELILCIQQIIAQPGSVWLNFQRLTHTIRRNWLQNLTLFLSQPLHFHDTNVGS